MKDGDLALQLDHPPSRTINTTVLFISHLIVYSTVLVSAVVVNMIVAPTHPWFLLIMVGWCGLLILHAKNVIGFQTRDQ